MRIKKGQIYKIDLGQNLGSEQNGIRPCVIVQNNAGNASSTTTIIVPLTKAKKKFTATHYELKQGKGNLKMDSTALCEQVKTISTDRIKQYVGELDKSDIEQIDDRLKISLGI